MSRDICVCARAVPRENPKIHVYCMIGLWHMLLYQNVTLSPNLASKVTCVPRGTNWNQKIVQGTHFEVFHPRHCHVTHVSITTFCAESESGIGFYLGCSWNQLGTHTRDTTGQKQFWSYTKTKTTLLYQNGPKISMVPKKLT